MKVKFLGTGTSTGVPEIGCSCEVCTSDNIKDRRLRASVLISINETRLLIDCGPDFRQQILPEQFSKIHAVLLTHEHYDHVGGMDDLRPFCRFGDVDIYGNRTTLNALKDRIPYSFTENKYPGVPLLNLHEIESDDFFSIQGVNILPVKLMHYKLPILGYRIGNFAYLTDVKYIPEEEYDKLKDLDVLVISALRIGDHMSHLNLAQALDEVKKISPKQAYFIHMSHQMGLHDKVERDLPENVSLSYDGLDIEL
ncbi:MBL fold metallo-hydrolase [Dysgonomonas sp. Marseille-P4677]|uniref:MBL fold metallo-hydrolase n=1 Tax=Dysgonomonas sp. Marseille-P4677 TaxID=2364790 RepID=UPI001913907C|nr:MBL fold metallo-hydrolase [Dysgonomonas sp. Marseille-P4677]MBK5721783.1 MBL fold metallo-hydrolase [Dysgonomonas sp. Marseille-P4677]